MIYFERNSCFNNKTNIRFIFVNSPFRHSEYSQEKLFLARAVWGIDFFPLFSFAPPLRHLSPLPLSHRQWNPFETCSEVSWIPSETKWRNHCGRGISLWEKKVSNSCARSFIFCFNEENIYFAFLWSERIFSPWVYGLFSRWFFRWPLAPRLCLGIFSPSILSPSCLLLFLLVLILLNHLIVFSLFAAIPWRNSLFFECRQLESKAEGTA